MNLQFGLRRGQRARALVTTTPRPIPLLTRLQEDKWTVTTGGRTSDNINLDERTIEVLTSTYGGTRIGAQELDGKLLQNVEGALWTREVIERSRVASLLPGTGRWQLEELSEGATVMAVRPWAPSTMLRMVPLPEPGRNLTGSWSAWIRRRGLREKSDACGIVVCGSRGAALYVLEDATVRGLSPEGWASRVAAAAARWKTGLVVAEANNGGAMVESVLKAADLRAAGAAGPCLARANAPGPSRSRSSSRRARRSSRASSRSSRPSSAGWSPAGVMRGPGARRTGPMRWCGR